MIKVEKMPSSENAPSGHTLTYIIINNLSKIVRIAHNLLYWIKYYVKDKVSLMRVRVFFILESQSTNVLTTSRIFF